MIHIDQNKKKTGKTEKNGSVHLTHYGQAQSADSIKLFLADTGTVHEQPDAIMQGIAEQAGGYLSYQEKERLWRAYDFAKQAHEGQMRLSGEPYIVHPLKATEILLQIEPDLESLMACLLHDVIEDTPVTYQDIENTFGSVVADLCEGLVKVSKVRYKKAEDRSVETLKKTFLAMAKDLRVIFVKIADRIHNIQTLHFHPKPQKRRKIAEETLKIYIPICKKLGLYSYQLYLENGVFRVLHPHSYERVMEHLEHTYGQAQNYLEQGRKQLGAYMHKNDIVDWKLKARVKSPFRVYEKLTKKYKSTDVSKVLDVLAFRVIVSSVAECYQVLGILHKQYNPLINKIKDYIAVPKFNNYQSIHTTILGMFDFPVEIQIRTWQMEQVAEYGVAAHFAYSEKNKPTQISDKQSKWIQELKDLVNEYKAPTASNQEKFQTNLDIEVLNKTIFVYTPQGDVLEFPTGSTILDFAFRVHTDLGLKFKNGLVDGVIKPIDHVLHTGDVVSINTFRNKYTATKHREDFLRTSSAKTKLMRFIRSQERDLYIHKGITMLNKKLQRFDLPLWDNDANLIAAHYNKKEDAETLFLSLIDKQQTATSLIRKFYPIQVATYEKSIQSRTQDTKDVSRAKTSSFVRTGVLIDGLKHLDYSFCKNCQPEKGVDIIAKVDKAGIKIHTVECSALASIHLEKLMEAHRTHQERTHPYTMHVCVYVPHGVAYMSVLIDAFKQWETQVCRLSVTPEKDNIQCLDVVLQENNPSRFSFIIQALQQQYSFVQEVRTRFSATVS